MEFVLLALIAIFLVVVAPIWALVGLGRLKRRVDDLEQELADLRGAAPPDQPASAWTPTDAPSAASPAPDDPPPPPQPAQSPWPQPAAPTSPPPPPAPATPGRFVLTSARAAQLSAWLRENWFIAIAAVSLGLAGVFFVQYGIENGLLSPRLRVLGAIGLGLALIGAGEVLRRRLGDEHDLAAFLPSALSGAGLVAIFAGILAARQLYGLIGPTTAFAGLGLTALAAIALGWFYGPFLIAFGIIGATAAPFLVGGSSEDPWVLFYYFALIAGAGLAVDALKRTAWISTLAMVLPAIAAWLLWTGTAAGAQHLLAFALLLALMAIALPPLSGRPGHDGPSLTEALLNRGKTGWPEFPTRLAIGGALTVLGFAAQAAPGGIAEFWLALTVMAAVFALTAFWLRHAPALQDIALFAGLAITGTIALAGIMDWPVAEAWRYTLIAPEAAPPRTLSLLTALGLALSALAAVTGLSGRHWGWSAGAAVLAPAILVSLDLFWWPLAHLGQPAWALHGIAVAALMTLGATQSRTRQPDAPLATALFALSAITMLGFAAVVLLTKTALTLAFALLAATAAWLDRRYDLAPLTLFVKAAALACSFRLIIDPGLFWAIEANWPDMALAYLGTIALLAAGWVVLAARMRRRTQMVVESVAAAVAGVGATVVLLRAFDTGTGIDTHWGLSLLALVWMISAAAQLYRAQAGFRWLRLGLAGVFGLLGALFLLGGLVLANPLDLGGRNAVRGLPLFGSLTAAYALPALLIGTVTLRATRLHRWLRLALGLVAAGLAAFWIGLEIRHLWRGPDLSQPGVTDPEMYSYTIALIALSAGLLAAALLRRSSLLRKLGLAAAALAVAKVFLLDASGLTGLTRVFSFLALGLALGGLAMVNRWIMALQAADGDPSDASEDPP